MVGCEFHRCRWILDDAAGRTLSLMKAMVERGGAMRALVERSLGIAGETAALPDQTMVDKTLH